MLHYQQIVNRLCRQLGRFVEVVGHRHKLRWHVFFDKQRRIIGRVGCSIIPELQTQATGVLQVGRLRPARAGMLPSQWAPAPTLEVTSV
jgi:hypothetical protein